MKSSASFRDFEITASREPRYTRTVLIKLAIGLGLLAALFYWGQIDLSTLANLAGAPLSILISFILVFLTLPIGALRWGILLRAFGVPISFTSLFHFVAIASLTNLFLLGNVGGDAVRLFYAWRSTGHGGTRIAVSILADRVLGVLAIVTIAALFTIAHWTRIQHVPGLAALGISVLLVFAGSMGGAGALIAAPRLARAFKTRLAGAPRIARSAAQIHDAIVIARGNPSSWLAAYVMALILQACAVLSIFLIANSLRIGLLAPTDYLFAVPLTLIANALPMTPNGLGVGEVAFDQICRWLEPEHSGAAYSSISLRFGQWGPL
jgi:uncharacterized protein (TIRG00374 family)